MTAEKVIGGAGVQSFPQPLATTEGRANALAEARCQAWHCTTGERKDHYITIRKRPGFAGQTERYPTPGAFDTFKVHRVTYRESRRCVDLPSKDGWARELYFTIFINAGDTCISRQPAGSSSFKN